MPGFLRDKRDADGPLTRIRAKKQKIKLLRRRDDSKGDVGTNSLGTYSSITSVQLPARSGSNNMTQIGLADAKKSHVRKICTSQRFDNGSESRAEVNSKNSNDGHSLIGSTNLSHHPHVSSPKGSSRKANKAGKLANIKRGRRAESVRVHSSVQPKEDLPISTPASAPQSVDTFLVVSSRNRQGRSNINSTTYSTRSPPAKSVKPAENLSKLGTSVRDISFRPSVHSTPETALSPKKLEQLKKAPKKPRPVLQRARKLAKRIFGQEGHLSPQDQISPPNPTRSRGEKRRLLRDASQREAWDNNPDVAVGYEGIDSFQHQASPKFVRPKRQTKLPTKLKDFVVNIRGKKQRKSNILAAIPEEVAVVNFRGKRRRANRPARSPRGSQ